MPRIARRNMTVSFFHIMTQGLNKEYIFKNDNDKEFYERLITLCKKEYNVNLLAYCIMDNHAHKLIKIENTEDMSKFMHKINTQYALYYNNKYNRTGYVFKNRYKSQMIDSINHLYKCIDYIHDNPVKARICENRNQYRFSSYTKLYESDQIKIRKMLENQLNGNYIDEEENNSNNIDFLEYITEDKKIICRQEIENYIKENKITKNKLLEDKNNLRKMVIYLKSKKISYRIMEEIVGIGRETLRRLIS